MTIEEANALAREISEENAAENMNNYLTELEEEALDRMMAEHEQMLYACMSYDEDAIYYGT